MFIYVQNIESITSAEFAAALASLPQWRREQAMKFKYEQGRKECAFSYLLLCKAMKDKYGIDAQPSFIIGEHGKPSLDGYPHIHFNLSHCKSAVVCAISDTEVGVDIEMTGRYSEALARYCMNEAEMRQILLASSPDTEFTRLWTQKEAVFKLIGSGISDDIKNILYKDVYLRTWSDISASFVVSASLFEKKAIKILTF